MLLELAALARLARLGAEQQALQLIDQIIRSISLIDRSANLLNKVDENDAHQLAQIHAADHFFEAAKSIIRIESFDNSMIQ